jgi:hypothetical protein
MDEAAQLLGISPRTAYRTWSFARAWPFNILAAIRSKISRGR